MTEHTLDTNENKGTKSTMQQRIAQIKKVMENALGHQREQRYSTIIEFAQMKKMMKNILRKQQEEKYSTTTKSCTNEKNDGLYT